MKYVVTFKHKSEKKYSDTTLIFGEYDIKGIAQKCFEMGSLGWYNGVTVKVDKDNPRRPWHANTN